MSHEEYHMGFFANSFLLWTDSRSKRLPGFLSSVHASFFPGKGSFWSTPSVKYRLTLQLPLPGGDCGPGVSLFFIFFLSAAMKELHPFSLDQQVSAHFSLFLTGEEWRLSTWNLKYQTPSVQEFRDLLSCFPSQNVLCPCTSRIFCVSVTRVSLTVCLGCVYTWVVKFRVWENLIAHELLQRGTFSLLYCYKGSFYYY